MNILFLSLGRFESINQYSLYTDLLRQFAEKDHKVYVISSREKRTKLPTELVEENNATILKVRVGNITKTNLIEKGISTITLEKKYIKSIVQYFNGVKFDLILYTTPPITFAKVVSFVKKRDGAKSYLLLKDIFPQNAVDLGILNEKGIIYHFFKRKEQMLYGISDYIGCMSQANCEYIIKHNPQINPDIVEICPNSIEVRNFKLNVAEKKQLRLQYGIPLDKRVFVYGGNLGKPQGIPFLMKFLENIEKDGKSFFLIVGDGTEYKKLALFLEKTKLENVKLMRKLPKEEFDRMIAACDVGMIFLNYRFTIPNFPSRLLSYMQAGLPIFACIDMVTDVGKVIVEGEFGWSCESDSIDSALKCIEYICEISNEELENKGAKAYQYLCEHYKVSVSYNTIVKKFLRKEV